MIKICDITRLLKRSYVWLTRMFTKAKCQSYAYVNLRNLCMQCIIILRVISYLKGQASVKPEEIKNHLIAIITTSMWVPIYKFFIYTLHFVFLYNYMQLLFKNVCRGPIIHNYNLSVRITALFLTSLILCVLILYMNGGTYSLKSTPNNRFVLETFHGSFIYFQSFCQISAERRAPKIYFHIDVWPGV